jgi:hypothetical protein
VLSSGGLFTQALVLCVVIFSVRADLHCARIGLTVSSGLRSVLSGLTIRTGSRSVRNRFDCVGTPNECLAQQAVRRAMSVKLHNDTSHAQCSTLWVQY